MADNASWRASALRCAAAACVSWVLAALATAVLGAFAPRAMLTDPLLPFGWRLVLLCTEWASLAVAVALCSALCVPLLHGERRATHAAWRWSCRGIRATLVSAGLLFLGTSWSVFWITGQFLDREGLTFCADNTVLLFRYAAEFHPLLLFGAPAAIVAVAVAGVRPILSVIERFVSPPLRRRLAAVVIGMAASCAVVTGVGDLMQESAGHLYEFHRDYRTGPLTHYFRVGRDRRGDHEDRVLPSAPATVRKNIIRMEEYAAGVDRRSMNALNVVLIIVDSLRSDQLAAYGDRRDVMPEVNALAREAQVYADCYTQASHTNYATPCPLSSQYPLRGRTYHTYAEHIPYPRVLIYDVLKALGYRTVIFSSQNEDWCGLTHYLQTGTLDRFFHAGQAGASGRVAIDDRLTLDAALQWVDQAPGGPFFMYLNLQNAHAPYKTPDDFPRRFGRKPDFTISAGYLPRDKLGFVKDVYADSLSYVDFQIGRLIGRLKERQLWDRTVFIVTGDHGEAFYEHDFAGHGVTVYDEVMRVPLIVRVPGSAGRVDERPAQLVDVPPTICGALKIPVHPAFQGEDLLAVEFKADRARYVLTQTSVTRQYAVIRSGFKLIYDADLARYFLYDLKNDRGERADVSSSRPEVVRDLAARLAAWRKVQVDYYEDPSRQGKEYPPALAE